MIGAAVSRIEVFYQQRYVAFLRKLARGLARLLWDDPKLEVRGSYVIPGADIPVSDDWSGAATDGARLGDYSFYQPDIDPYHVPYKSPGERMAMLRQEVQMWVPALPFLAQSGHQIDMREYFDVMAKYGTPEFRRIFKSNQPPMMPPDGAQQDTIPGAGGPHEYMHHSSGGAGQDPGQQALAMMQPPQGGE
jgi:hypothetical protein